jgi:hypothetical protein
MTSPLCVKRCECEECQDKGVCEILSAEKSYRLLVAQFEEEWKERTREGL